MPEENDRMPNTATLHNDENERWDRDAIILTVIAYLSLATKYIVPFLGLALVATGLIELF